MLTGALPQSAFKYLYIPVRVWFHNRLWSRLFLMQCFSDFFLFPSILQESFNPNLSRQMQRRFSVANIFWSFPRHRAAPGLLQDVWCLYYQLVIERLWATFSMSVIMFTVWETSFYAIELCYYSPHVDVFVIIVTNVQHDAFTTAKNQSS